MIIDQCEEADDTMGYAPLPPGVEEQCDLCDAPASVVYVNVWEWSLEPVCTDCASWGFAHTKETLEKYFVKVVRDCE